MVVGFGVECTVAVSTRMVPSVLEGRYECKIGGEFGRAEAKAKAENQKKVWEQTFRLVVDRTNVSEQM